MIGGKAMHKKRSANGKRLKKGEYYKSSRDLYEYRWCNQEGNRVSVYAKTLSELRILEDEILNDQLNGFNYSDKSTTVNECYELWKQMKNNCRETTMCSYTRPYELYIAPEFGTKRLKDINYSTVVLFYRRLKLQNHLSDGTLKNINKVLNMVLEVAVKNDWIRKNPCRGALSEVKDRFPCVNRADQVLSLEQQKAFEDFLFRSSRFRQYYPLFVTSLWTGMRAGELTGLRWKDIDLENGLIFVDHSLEYFSKGKNKESVYFVNQTKTGKCRVIPMFTKVREALLMEKEYQEEHGIRCVSVIDGFDHPYTDFVFLRHDGRVYNYKSMNNLLDSIVKKQHDEVLKNGSDELLLPHIHNHMLRHSFATRLREAKFDVKATADILGHNSIRMTLDVYTNTDTDFDKREVSFAEQYFDNLNS